MLRFRIGLHAAASACTVRALPAGVIQSFETTSKGKNGASGRDPALHGVWTCSHIDEYAALSKAPCALADGLRRSFSG
jgi:hypothetical protein